ncbi:hypothetical protein TNCV_2858631 [Trichonephila clavipes]|nr:hypothetical protein TNCV_2858631 [Trichonephila clavipes]
MDSVFTAGGTINSRQAASPLVRLMEEEERWKAPDHHQVSLLKIGEEASQIVFSPAWRSKLRLTTGVTYPFAMMNFADLYPVFAN